MLDYVQFSSSFNFSLLDSIFVTSHEYNNYYGLIMNVCTWELSNLIGKSCLPYQAIIVLSITNQPSSSKCYHAYFLLSASPFSFVENAYEEPWNTDATLARVLSEKRKETLHPPLQNTDSNSSPGTSAKYNKGQFPTFHDSHIHVLDIIISLL